MKKPARTLKRSPRKRKRVAVPRYRFQRFLCSAGEWRFFQVLKELVGDRYDILMQVRVAAILRPARRADWERDGRRVSQKAFDFVLVAKGSSRVHCAIELDDRSHEEPERVKRDSFLERACLKAGLPLLRFRVVRDYDRAEITKQILETGKAVQGEV